MQNWTIAEPVLHRPRENKKNCMCSAETVAAKPVTEKGWVVKASVDRWPVNLWDETSYHRVEVCLMSAAGLV